MAAHEAAGEHEAEPTQMADAGIGELPLYHEDRPSKAPTAARVLELLDPLARSAVSLRNESALLRDAMSFAARHPLWVGHVQTVAISHLVLFGVVPTDVERTWL
ncbi:MAG: hypothetical protein ACYC0E_13755 [Acidimicrobiales bacterium]